MCLKVPGLRFVERFLVSLPTLSSARLTVSVERGSGVKGQLNGSFEAEQAIGTWSLESGGRRYLLLAVFGTVRVTAKARPDREVAKRPQLQ